MTSDEIDNFILVQNKRQRIPKGHSKMDTDNIQDEDKQSKNTTQYALDTTMRKQIQIT